MTIGYNASRIPISRWGLAAILCVIPFALSIRSLSLAHSNFQIGIDFRLTYTAARAWVLGQDPYDDETLKRVWSESGMPNATPPGLPQTPNVYPLSVAPVLAPLAWMSYPSAFALWLIFNASAAAIMAYRLIAQSLHAEAGASSNRIERGPIPESSMQLAPTLKGLLPFGAAGILLLGFPLHYALVVGNLAILTALFALFAIQHRDTRPMLAGVLFGVALVKHTLCAPLALLFLLEGRWRLLAGAAATQILLLGVATLGYSGTPTSGWISNMLATGFDSLSPGAVNHFASLDYTALHIELPALLYRISPGLADWRILILSVLGIAMAAGFRKSPDTRENLAFIEFRYIVMLTFTLIAFYHRVYDVILVIYLLVAWLLRYRNVIPYSLSTCLWFALVMSMFSGAAVDGGSANANYLTLAFVHTNTIWALLIIQLVGTAAMWRMQTGGEDFVGAALRPRPSFR